MHSRPQHMCGMQRPKMKSNARLMPGCAATPPIPTKKILQPLLLRLLNARFERPSEALAQRLA